MSDDSIAWHVKRWAQNAHLRPKDVPAPGPGQESVWDYPRPPALVPTDALVRVTLNGTSIAETCGALRMCETASPPVYYLPPDDIDFDRLEPVRHATHCEWKGRARYWDVVAGDLRAGQAAFGYDAPNDLYAAVAGYVGFYPGRVECFVGDERVRPQAGGFYAGWITDAIVGPFKGDPGTGGW